ncbi:MAG TPA: tetratricopeptide repeat protein [Verrucomicrobiota bacterium]|nr:tetratricopeptide repeat protein [Verrucomicrobiota bacterium]HNU50699.1 tetratricopeptide repeat protein [Verrucomicrobiota bacterium]
MRRTRRFPTGIPDAFMAALAANPDPRILTRSRTELPVSARTLRLLDAAMEHQTQPHAAVEGQPDTDPARAMLGRGMAFFRRGRNREALAAFDQAAALCREARDTQGWARAVESRADLLCSLGRHAGALAAYETAAALRESAGDAAGQGYCAWGCGDMLARLRRPRKAFAAYQQAAALFLDAGDHRSRCHCLRGGGDALSCSGRPREALAVCEQAQELFHEAGETAGLARCIQSCGNALRRLNRPGEALTAFVQAEAFFDSAGDTLGRGLCVENRADLLADLGRTTEALLAYEQAKGLLRMTGDDASRARCLWGWGDIAAALHQPDEALPEYHAAYRIFVESEAWAEAAILAAKTLRTAGETVALHGLKLAREPINAVHRLAGNADRFEATRQGLVHFMVRTSKALSPTDALELLSGIEAALPVAHRDLLGPARLALEVAAGRRDVMLPDQPDLTRQAARKFSDSISPATPEPTPHAPFKARTRHPPLADGRDPGVKRASGPRTSS